MRAGVIIAAATLIITTMTASAQEANSTERAYTLTLTCFNVAVYYHDQAGVMKSADAIEKMGRVLGHSSNKQISDRLQMASVLGNALRTDTTIMAQHRDVCRRYGLVS